MYIKTFIKQSRTFQIKEKQPEGNFLVNRTQSKKQLKQQKKQKGIISQGFQFTSSKRFTQKHSDSAFDDEIFTALYKINRKLSYERYKTLSHRSQPPKLSFKLNYIQTIPSPRPDIKKSKIQSYITKNNDHAVINFTHTNKQQKNFYIKERLIKSGQKNENKKIPLEIDKFRALSSRRVQSSFGNYDTKVLFDNKFPNNCFNPEKPKHKLSTRNNELPQYVQNIIKPCKIQGIELIDRPFTSIGRRFSFRNNKAPNEIANNKLSLKMKRQDEQQNTRTIKTARQADRGMNKLDTNRRNNRQRLRNNKKSDFEPWGQQQQINLQQEQGILFSIE